MNLKYKGDKGHMENTVTINDNPAVKAMINRIKLLPRNTKEYPDVSREDQIDAGSFIYALQTLGAGGDGNLTSLVWNLWKELSIAVQSGGLTENLQSVVERLHKYLNDIGMFNEVEA